MEYWLAKYKKEKERKKGKRRVRAAHQYTYMCIYISCTDNCVAIK